MPPERAAAAGGRGRRWRTPAVWLTLAALAAGAFALDRAGVFAPPPRTDAHGHALGAGPRFLVRTPIDRLAAAEIVVDGAAWRFDRGADGAWRRGADHGGAELSARIGAALEAFGRARIVREVTASREVKAYGVLAPRISVVLYADDSGVPRERYFFGDPAPDGLNRYVLIFGEFLVVTVPEYHVENLAALVASLGEG